MEILRTNILEVNNLFTFIKLFAKPTHNSNNLILYHIHVPNSKLSHLNIKVQDDQDVKFSYKVKVKCTCDVINFY